MEPLGPPSPSIFFSFCMNALSCPACHWSVVCAVELHLHLLLPQPVSVSRVPRLHLFQADLTSG